MTGRRTGPSDAPEDPPSDPLTGSSVDGPVGFSPVGRAVPTVGYWVGPEDEPARFERLEHVGGGAEGAIFRARRVGPSGETEFVALKQYRPPPGAPANWPLDGTWRQIENQAWLLRGLPRTDHLVRVRDEFLGATSGPGLGDDPQSANKAFDTPFVVMEWIDGARPDVAMRASSVPLTTRLGWVRDLAEAVDLLHSVSRTDRFPLVHGDIKPGNCLVTRDRGLVLVDTGALQLADGVGNVRGLRSPPYAAPEVLARPGRRRGTATDLYSLGAVAFYLLTAIEPPSAEHDGYEQAARDLLLGRQSLQADLRPAVAAHIMKFFAADPAQRTRSSAWQWARELTEIVCPPVPTIVVSSPRRVSRRRVALVGGLAILVAAGVSAVLASTGGDTPASGHAASPAASAPAAPGATTSTPAPATWPSKMFADLPPFKAGGGRVLYEQTFATPSGEWPDATLPGYETHYRDGGYELHILGHGVYQPVPGPQIGSVTDEVVSATATVQSGQGGWGIWCRGIDQAGSSRYEFLISHAGAVQIAGPDGYGTGWVYLVGLDTSAPVTLAARCADVVGAPVELTLAVNGRTALTYRPDSTGLLGPGYVGIEGMTFSDVSGPTIAAAYSRLEVRRAVA